ncbi:MAG: hypothetical protein K2Q33_07810 [Gammaproteobacteria bacterium]|nr:hypothetical protein [Gammaproteobacteria bacterium]
MLISNGVGKKKEPHNQIHKVPPRRSAHQPSIFNRSSIIEKIRVERTSRLNAQNLVGWDNLSAGEKALFIALVLVGGSALIFMLSSMLILPSVAGQSPPPEDVKNSKPSGDTAVSFPHSSHRMFNSLYIKPFSISPFPSANGVMATDVPFIPKSQGHQSFFTLPTCPFNAFDELAAQFVKRLILTPETIAYYNERPGLKEKDIQRIKDFIRRAAGLSQSIYCKMESVLQSNSFTFELSANDRYSMEVHGESNPRLNRLILPAGISEKDFYFHFYIFIHEMHHQNIGLSNKEKGFFSHHENYLSALELPFGSSIEDVAEEAQKFEKIIEAGNRRAETFLQWLQQPKKELKPSQRKLMDRLHQYANGYVPQIKTAFLQQEQIDWFKKAGHVNKDLSLTQKFFVATTAQGFSCYIYAISYIAKMNRYEIKFYTAAPDASIAEKILLDTRYIINDTYSANEPKKLLAKKLPEDAPMQAYEGFKQFIALFEADTCIHQTLELNPKVLDMLFPQLKEWHLKRISQSQLECLKDPDYMLHAQSTSENRKVCPR